jgi:hypothetical protein
MPGPFTDEPVLGATELPAPDVPADVPPALLPLLCASAKVLESASAPANAIVVSFMVVSLVMTGRKPRQTTDVPCRHEDVSIAPVAGLIANQRFRNRGEPAARFCPYMIYSER